MSSFNFADLKNTDVAEEAAPRVGGAGFLVDTGCQPCVIKHAYLERAKSGATMFQCRIEAANGTVVDLFGGFGDCIISGDDKGNKNFYVDKKSGEKKLLPGMQNFANLVKVVLNKEVDQLQPTKQVAVEKYNFDTKKREPMPVQMISELVGKPVIGGFVRIKEDKYSGEGTREYNNVNQWYNATTKQCAFEMRHGASDKLHHDEWHAANEGKNRDTSTQSGATDGAPASNEASPSLLKL